MAELRSTGHPSRMQLSLRLKHPGVPFRRPPQPQKAWGTRSCTGRLYTYSLSANFPSLGFPLPRATSSAIPRPHRRRAASRRAKGGRTRRPGAREAWVAPPHSQPRPPLGTSTPQGLPLPFPLTARQEGEGGSRSARAPPTGGDGRGEEVADRLPAAPLLEREGGATRRGGFPAAAGEAARVFV